MQRFDAGTDITVIVDAWECSMPSSVEHWDTIQSITCSYRPMGLR